VTTETNFGEIALRELLSERRKDRRAKYIRLFSVLLVLTAGFGFNYSYLNSNSDSATVSEDGSPFVAVVNLEGEIAKGPHTISDENVKTLLEKAFSSSAEGVIISMSSPGGSPVQSELIKSRIQRLKKEHGKKVILVGEETLASGGYMVAMGADEIYVQPSTIVGSIGVRMAGFGAVEFMKKVGVERRLYTAGKNKAPMDTWSPQNPDSIQHIDAMLQDIHVRFIAMVEESRSDKVTSKEDLYDGRIWTGSQAVALGLVDGLGTVEEVAQQHFGTDNLRGFQQPPSILNRLGFAVQAAIQAGIPTTSYRVETVW
jgi:signal peptide peptidase SppA